MIDEGNSIDVKQIPEDKFTFEVNFSIILPLKFDI